MFLEGGTFCWGMEVGGIVGMYKVGGESGREAGVERRKEKGKEVQEKTMMAKGMTEEMMTEERKKGETEEYDEDFFPARFH